MPDEAADKSAPTEAADKLFALVTVLLPLTDGDDKLPSDWTTGPWTSAGLGTRPWDVETRCAPYLNSVPIQELVSKTRRAHRVVHEDLYEGVRCVALELLLTRPQSPKAPTGYLLVHLELRRGPKHGVSAQLESVAGLARPRREACGDLVAKWATDWTLDTRPARALTVALACDTSQRMLRTSPPSTEHWLQVLAALPTDNFGEASAPPGALLQAGDMTARVLPQGVSVAGLSGKRDFVGETRAHLVDAMLLALLQRDVLIGFGRELAARQRYWRWPAHGTAKRFDEFRRRWWWQVLTDADRVQPVFHAWQEVSGARSLAQQLSEEIGDLRADSRARSNEVVAVLAVIVAVTAFLLQLILG